MPDMPIGAGHNTGAVERPEPGEAGLTYGSDVIADVLRALDLPFVALNPGASFRGLHDSIVNHLGNSQPQMLLCLHEEHAVALAHGYAKVAERPLAVVLHSNVGLMHGSMAIFNAWCDRVPMLILGATGPVDAARRRPWIDWIHTARDQGALVRSYVKWDDQPASATAAVESVLRAHLISTTQPFGPTYVNLDAGMQETETEPTPPPRVERFRAPAAPPPDPATLAAAAKALSEAKRPLILAGRVSRDGAAWELRIRLAERLGAAVLTDLKTPAAFPSRHPLHAAPSGTFPNAAAVAVMRQADAVLSLDWIDLAGTLTSAGAKPATIIQASLDQLVHNGWSMDHFGLSPVDHPLLSSPDAVVAGLMDLLPPEKRAPWLAQAEPAAPPAAQGGEMSIVDLARTLRQAVAGMPSCLIRGSLSWSGELWEVDHPLSVLGYDGGGGIGSGPGMTVGAALALRDTGLLPVSVLGDGDFMMGCTAFWTAARYGIPLLCVVANNQSFFNDEVHQERVANMRGRNAANRWIGQRIGDPDIDIAAIARAQGCFGAGPVADPDSLGSALLEALAAVRDGKPAIIDARIAKGYSPAMQSALTREARHG